MPELSRTRGKEVAKNGSGSILNSKTVKVFSPKGGRHEDKL